MNTEGFDNWLKMNKNFTSPLTDWNKSLTQLFKRMTHDNLEMLSDHFNRLSKQIDRLNAAHKPEEALSILKNCMEEDLHAVINNTQKTLHHSMENMEEFAKICGSAMTKATEKTMYKAEKFTEKAEKATR